MHFNKDERAGLFIDGVNLYATCRLLGFEIDFRRLRSLFLERTHLIRAFYYTALTTDLEYSPVKPLVDWLDYNGYTTVTKAAKEFCDAGDRRKNKAGVAIEIVVDAMRFAEHIDHVILFSGDGDLCSLVAALQDRGKRVSVVSTLQTQPPMIGDELRRQADQFIEIASLVPSIERAGAAS